MSTAEPRYVMLCPGCGLEWHTTAPENHQHSTCRGIEAGTGRSLGCGRKLPAPVPERSEESESLSVQRP